MPIICSLSETSAFPESTICKDLHCTMTSAIGVFNKLGHRMKALYISALVLSVALMVFGAVLLMSAPVPEGPATSVTAENSVGGGDPIGSGDGVGLDGIFDVGGTTRPTEPSLLDPRTSTPTSSPTKRLGAPGTLLPSTQQPSNLHGGSTLANTDDPTQSPTIKQSEAPSLQHSDLPSERPSASPTDPSALTFIPTESPESSPSADPTSPPSSSVSPTLSTKPTSSNAPTPEPLFRTHAEPANPSSTYFNYNTTHGSRYGPNSWENVTVLNSTENYWREFGFVSNQCNDRSIAQSPIDVCTKPERHCVEYHEFRAKVSFRGSFPIGHSLPFFADIYNVTSRFSLQRGDFKISSEFMEKQILPNKLRVLVARRVGEEPDPPHVDFAGVGAKDLDLLNIDIKLPSEHTVCGRRFDGEMQYYFFHPVKQSLVVVSWLLDASVGNPTNEHMQLLINEFQASYDGNEEACFQKSLNESAPDGGASNASHNHAGDNDPLQTGTRQLAKNDQNKKGGGIWDPFHRSIQRTIHFWGYTGSLTEPPCAGSTLWRIMDVPVPIGVEQLTQMQSILFNNRGNETCRYTSNHYKGSVARPAASNDVSYYKCTRSDYVSDDEREVCGDGGCAKPFGRGLDPYVEPIIFVTGPPSKSPTTLPSQSPTESADGPL